MAAVVSAPEQLGDHHDLDSFDSGNHVLDGWLREWARKNEAAGASRTYVVCVGARVVGYYALSTFRCGGSAVSGRVRRNMPEPIPAVLLGRLAVDRSCQGHGVGTALLRDAVRRTAGIAERLGVRVLAVQAIDEAARAFYEARGLQATRTDPMFLVAPVGDIQAALR